MEKNKTWRIWENVPFPTFMDTVTNDDSVYLLCPEEFEIMYGCDYRSYMSRAKTADIVFGSFSLDFHKKHTNLLDCKNVKLHLWDNYFLYYAIQSWEDFSIQNKPITNLFTCMNHRAHPYRVTFVDQLAKYNLLKDNFISWHYVDAHIIKQFEYWTPKKVYLDGKQNPPKQELFPEQMYNSLINVVTESNIWSPFITEKTYNSIIGLKPFIIWGYPGSHAYLEKIGFKMHHDIIDYSFDVIKNNVTRCDMIMKELKRLSTIDFSATNNSMKEILNYNRQHAINIARSRIAVPDIVFKDNYYVNLMENVECKLRLLEQAS